MLCLLQILVFYSDKLKKSIKSSSTLIWQRQSRTGMTAWWWVRPVSAPLSWGSVVHLRDSRTPVVNGTHSPELLKGRATLLKQNHVIIPCNRICSFMPSKIFIEHVRRAEAGTLYIPHEFPCEIKDHAKKTFSPSSHHLESQVSMLL